MQIICKDGTVIQCEDFEATDSGVLFFQGTPGRGEESDEDEEEVGRESASGFVPVTELRFVLPDEMVQHQAPQQGAPERGAPGKMPPGGQQQTGMAQQQQMRQQPGQPQSGPEHGTR